MTHQTKIKICGLTSKKDIISAIVAGANALGFVFYRKSSRYFISTNFITELIVKLPPSILIVGLFVNATLPEVASVLTRIPLSVLQFHGDETPHHCATIAEAVRLPFLRVARIGLKTSSEDLLKYEYDYRTASIWFFGLLLDTLVEQYGGSGKIFDWSIIPKELGPRIFLSGGLNVDNVSDAVRRIRPYAVDISSGVEKTKGIKDPVKIDAFIKAVRLADSILNTS